jgi:hypothetical protein
MPRRTRIARAVAALAALAACLAATTWQCRPRPPELSGLDESGLSWRLEALGYRAHEELADRVGAGGKPVYRGLYFARRDVAGPWEEVVSRPRGGAASWHGVLVARRRVAGVHVDDPDALEVGAFALYGDPADLERIARALGLPR